MKKYNIGGFTMVEMLAVIAVISIIVALVVPNGIFARTTGEEATARAQGAALELAMANYQSKGGMAAGVAWANAGNTTTAKIAHLQDVGALPPNLDAAKFQTAFEGYTVIFPAALGGTVTIRRSSDNVQIYP